MSASERTSDAPRRGGARIGGLRHPSEMPQTIDPVAAYVDALSAHPSVRRLILFGSRAIGDHWPRSDVDMAVVLGADEGGAWPELRRLAEGARTLIPIDLVPYEKTSGAFREAIDRHGRTVFERA